MSFNLDILNYDCGTSKNLSLKYQRFSLAGAEFNEFELLTELELNLCHKLKF